MSGIKKVIWKEGLCLQPQHFQQFERFLFNSTNTRFSAYNPYYYGFSLITIDDDAVVNGTFSVTRAVGVMPDGTIFNIPKEDHTPPSRPFEEHFTHDQQKLDVYFGLPMVDSTKANVNYGNESRILARYNSRALSTPDEVYGKQKKDIEIGDYNFVILFGDENRDNYSSIQVGRLIRNSSGQIENDPTFIPPLLQINASQILMDKLRSLLEMLLAKSTSLSQGRKQLKGGFAEFGGGEGTAFRLLHTINTYTSLLNHHHFVPVVHPNVIFELLLQFVGSLCTFSAEVSLGNLPKYEHNNLQMVFQTFDNLIRRILGADISAGCVTVLVEEVGPASYICKIQNEALFSTGNFYFGVSANVQEKELIVGTLSRIKMCSRDRLELLIPSAMPGLPLIHVAAPPKGLSTKPGFVYFKLDQRGDFWNGIMTSGNISFYFPHQYQNLKMEMLVLKGKQ